MASFDPGYGETEVSEEERDALTPFALHVLGEPVLKASLYDIEQTLQDRAASVLFDDIRSGALGIDEILTDHFVRDLHRRLYGDLSNVALSILDESIAEGSGGPRASPYQRERRRSHGLPNYRLIRYADDWCLVVSGTRADAEKLREQAATVLSSMGLRLSPEKTLITHIDEGLDFLGWRIQRHRKRGTGRYYVYTYPARKAVMAVTGKVKTMCRRMDTARASMPSSSG